MNEILRNVNILAVIKHRPFNLVVIFLGALRGVFRRRLGVYSRLQVDQRISDLSITRVALRRCITKDSAEFWHRKFALTLTDSFKWDSERDHFLESHFLQISALGVLPLVTNDKEDYWSAVQLNWLFFSVRTGSRNADEARLIIESCCSLLENNREHWIFRTFTISEVITNIVKIKMYFGNSLDVDGDIEAFLARGVGFISGTLEVYELSDKTSLNHTNNHILANARALFWATKFFENEEILNTAEYVYEKWCLPLFDTGNLDEGSTIYHMIAAQCIFDISFFIDLIKLPRVDFLIIELEKNGFLESETFPVIGDVSPDPSLASVITDALKVSELIRRAHGGTENLPTKERYSARAQSDFEFFRVNNWHWVLHSRRGDKHIQHSHNDYGSPVLMYKNKTIICDLGRTSYSKIKGLPDLTLTNFHSVPQIGSLEQNPRGARDLYPNHYISPKVTAVINDGSFRSKLRVLGSDGYEVVCGKEYELLPNRIHGGSWFRFFGINRLDQTEFIIEDIVEVGSDKRVNFRFFMHEKIAKYSLASIEFWLNGVLITPSKYQVPISRYYGQIAKADAYEVFSEPSQKHNLTTYIRILNE